MSKKQRVSYTNQVGGGSAVAPSKKRKMSAKKLSRRKPGKGATSQKAAVARSRR
jgi:hypothetical protein